MIRIDRLSVEQLKRYHELLRILLEFAMEEEELDLHLICSLSQNLRNVGELLRKEEPVP